MNSARRHILLGAVKLLNLGLMILSFGLATLLVVSSRTEVALTQFFSMRVKLWNIVICAGLLLAWHLLFSLCGLYQSKRLATTYSIIMEAAKATSLSTICLAAGARVFVIRMATPKFILLFWIFSSILVISTRVAMRYFLGIVRSRGGNLRNVLILGTNGRAIEFARRVEAKSEFGYRILGFVDVEWAGTEEFRRCGYPVCCSFEGLADFLRRNVVDEVAFYLPLRSFYEHASQVAALCELHGIMMRYDSDIFDLKIAHSRADEFDGNVQLTTHTSSFYGWPILIKQVLDTVVSAALLIMLSPLLLVVAALIKLTSEGPVFFRQERVGINKRRFFIWKFRTMVPNAERMLPDLEMLNEVAGPVFKIKNDPRMTPIGSFLRRTSIDELPQLFNVLKGDMSLVGPRPLPVRDYEGFSEDWQRRRFSIRPGITCLWQVMGRSSITFDRWMELDIQYMDEWSLWLDFKILAQTIPAVVKGQGAA